MGFGSSGSHEAPPDLPLQGVESTVGTVAVRFHRCFSVKAMGPKSAPSQ